MTREEFEEIEDFSELFDFCSNYDCDIYNEIYDEDSYRDCIDEDIRYMVRTDPWETIRDYLDNLPETNYDYYRRTDNGWEGIDEDSDFDYIKDEVRDWAEEEEIFDEEEEEDGQENDEQCSEVFEYEEEEPEPDEPFTLGELVAVCKSSVQKIEDKSKDDPVKTRDEEHVETCDPITLL